VYLYGEIVCSDQRKARGVGGNSGAMSKTLNALINSSNGLSPDELIRRICGVHDNLFRVGAFVPHYSLESILMFN
jgi:hypothetical protein